MNKEDRKDLVERLREKDASWQAQCDGWMEHIRQAWPNEDHAATEAAMRKSLDAEAAAEIARLRRELEEARKALGDLIGHAKFVDVNFGISYAHLHESEAVYAVAIRKRTEEEGR